MKSGSGDDVFDLCYSDKGRLGIDLESAARLMLSGLVFGIVHDKRLMRRLGLLLWQIPATLPRPLQPEREFFADGYKKPLTEMSREGRRS
jgi:hypothetical protein